MPRVDRIADREVGDDADRQQQRHPATAARGAELPSPPLLGPAERQRPEHQRLHVAVRVRPQRASGTPPSDGPARPGSPPAPPPAAPSHRRRPLREACRTGRDRRRSPARAPPRRPAARRTPPCVLLQQLEIRLAEQRRDVVEERRFLHAVPAERVKHAARVAGFEAVLPAQRLERRVARRRGRRARRASCAGSPRSAAARPTSGAAMQY